MSDKARCGAQSPWLPAPTEPGWWIIATWNGRQWIFDIEEYLYVFDERHRWRRYARCPEPPPLPEEKP